MKKIFYANTFIDKDSSEKFKKFGASDSDIFIDTGFKKFKDSNLCNIRSILNSETVLYLLSVSHLGKTKREIKNQLEWLIKNNIPFSIFDIPETMDSKTRKDADLSIYIEYINYSLIEKENVKKGQAAGIQKAREKGIHLGREKIKYPDNWEYLYGLWENKEITAVEFMKRANLKKGTFYNLLKEYRFKSK